MNNQFEWNDIVKRKTKLGNRLTSRCNWPRQTVRGTQLYLLEVYFSQSHSNAGKEKPLCLSIVLFLVGEIALFCGFFSSVFLFHIDGGMTCSMLLAFFPLSSLAFIRNRCWMRPTLNGPVDFALAFLHHKTRRREILTQSKARRRTSRLRSTFRPKSLASLVYFQTSNKLTCYHRVLSCW